MKKMLILATGEVEEFDDGYAQRLCEFGKAEYVKEEKPVKAEVVVTDKVPEIETQCKGGCIGCVACKRMLQEKIAEFHTPIYEKRTELLKDEGKLLEILKKGTEKASKKAEETIREVRKAIQIGFDED